VLCIASPVTRCGKTAALQLVGAAVPRALSTSNTTPAALFRSIERWHPTLLIDEADALFGARSTERSEEIRGLLNAGHTRDTAYVIRVVGEDHEPRRFGVFGAKCIALIGSLPDTVRDRSIIVPMRRRLPGERLERLRLDRLGSLVEALRRKTASPFERVCITGVACARDGGGGHGVGIVGTLATNRLVMVA
jgi:putative DNA primase/helicase